jgi:hypothetical protein
MVRWFCLIAGSHTASSSGRLVEEANADREEVVYAKGDLDVGRPHKAKTFNFRKRRRIRHDGKQLLRGCDRATAFAAEGG